MTGCLCVSCGQPLESCNRVDFRQFKQVTSDCREFENGGEVCDCSWCGLVQRPRSGDWRENCRKIYAGYRAHHQGRGEEQRIFQSSSARSRSEMLISNVLDCVSLNDETTWLDYGCGEGHFLESLQRLCPGITLSGCDHSESCPSRLHNLGINDYFPVGVDVGRKFDWISMIHVVEHFFEPRVDLRMLRDWLQPKGRLFIQIPNLRNNPFDLVIADHGTFFVEETICALLIRSGFFVESVSEKWINKELSIIAGVDSNNNSTYVRPVEKFAGSNGLLESHCHFLRELKSEMRQMGDLGKLTIFGSSIGATWAATEFGLANVQQFLDEDESRHNSTHLNVPIRGPSPGMMNVVVPLESQSRDRIKAKYGF